MLWDLIKENWKALAAITLFNIAFFVTIAVIIVKIMKSFM